MKENWFVVSHQIEDFSYNVENILFHFEILFDIKSKAFLYMFCISPQIAIIVSKIFFGIGL